MTTVPEALDIIKEYVALAADRRTRALPPPERRRYEVLEEALRELIDGARPAPRKIENPSAAVPDRGGVAPANIQVTQKRDPRSAIETLAAALEMSTKDQKKLSSVPMDRMPVSAYTPPSVPAFMADYFGDSVVPTTVSTSDLVRSVVGADGEAFELNREVRILLGLELPPREPARKSAAVSAPSAPSVEEEAPPENENPQVIVHLIPGGTRRGYLESFEPEAGRIVLAARHAGDESEVVQLSEVLAVFFGVAKGAEPTPPNGDGVVVRLVNDRQVSGRTPDYVEGAEALTVIPEPRRGNVDRIWIPAWAVKAIEME